MKLIVLGSGTSVPHSQRSSSGYWLETGGGTILLDFSASAIHRMAQERLDWANLDAVWISHFHLDHCGGLSPFLFGTKHAPETRGRTKPLRIFGPNGLRNLLAAFDGANNYKLFAQKFPIEITEVEELEAFDILPGVKSVAASTPHTEDSLAIHIQDSTGATLVYTSDTGPTDVLAAFARRVDLLILECSFVKNKPVEKHLELSEAIRLIRKAEPKKAMLTHFYAEWDEFDFDNEVTKLSPMCEVLEAVDGLRIDVAPAAEPINSYNS